MIFKARNPLWNLGDLVRNLAWNLRVLWRNLGWNPLWNLVRNLWRLVWNPIAKMPHLRNLRAIILALFALFAPLNALDLMLLSEYDEDFVRSEGVENFLISEKLDGIRAFWDGKNLYSRNGKKLPAPAHFTRNFPPFAIDGELWNKRENFSEILSIINTRDNAHLWENLRFHIFDVPSETIGLESRLSRLRAHLAQNPSDYIVIIPQTRLKSIDELQSTLAQITRECGEGLVVRHAQKPYITGRSAFDMKMKAFRSDDCKIVAYTQGRGRFRDQVGAIVCASGEMRFKIGSGMSDDFRANPPPLGTIIEYKYSGKTSNNLPRFPVFLRVKE